MEYKVCKTFRNYKTLLIAGIFTLGFFALSTKAQAASVYYSVGQNTTSHETGAGNVTVSGTMATFTVAQTAVNMGVGDVIDYDTDNKKCYISGKTSTTVWSCTNATGGTPTAASGVVVNSVSHAFNSLNAAEAGAPTLLGSSDLTSIDVQLNFPCYYDSGADTTSVTVDGYTTDTTRYIKIYTPASTTTEANQSQRHNGRWENARYYMQISGNGIALDDNNIWIDGLQINNTANDWGISIANGGSGANGIAEQKVSNNILRFNEPTGSNNRGMDIRGTQSGSKAYIWNNILYGFGPTGSVALNLNDVEFTFYVYNNNIYTATSTSSIGINAGNVMAKNNIVKGFGNSLAYVGTFLSGTDYNATDGTDNIGQGTHNKISQTFSFVDSDNKDFHLSPLDTAAKNAGANLYADTDLPVATDIDGQARPNSATLFDIGADEGANGIYYSVGQSSSTMLTGTPTITISSNVATFTTAQTGNIGVGDRVTYGRIDISSFADQGGGVVRITTSANHGYSTGDYVSITGTTNYNGTYAIANASTSVFDITHSYTAESGGTTKYSANIAFIASKTSTTVWTLTGLRGASISDRASATTVNSITREYTSLNAAEAGAVDVNHLNTTDLAANSFQLNFPCYYDTGADTTAVTVDGYTTDATNYIKIYTPSNTSTEANISQRHQGKWDDGKYRLEVSNQTLFSPAINYVRIEGIQMKLTGNIASVNMISFNNVDSGVGGNIYVNNNIFKGVLSGVANNIRGIGVWSALAAPTINVYNNIVHDLINSSSYADINFITTNSGTLIAYNNTIYNCQAGFVSTTGINLFLVKNNILQRIAGNGFTGSGGFDSASNYNISNDSTAPGANSKNLTTVSFADIASKDFHLATNDTAARNAGADLSADANLPITTDIDGQTRPTGTNVVDIGADEGATAVYYSVGQNTNDHSIGNGGATCSTTGACTLTISSGTATFNYAQTATNLGVGDKVTYNTTSVAYISQKISQTQWRLVTAIGGTPADVTGQTMNSITHAFLSLNQAVGNGSNGAGDSSHLNTSDLKTNNYQLNIPCYYDTGTNNTGLTMATAYVTSLPNYIKIYTPNNTSTEVNVSQRHQGKWDSQKFAVDANSTFNLNIAYTVVDGLQFNIGTGGVVVYAGTERAIISNCIIKSSYSANYGIQVEGNASKEAFVYNNIIYDVAIGIARYYDGSGRTLYVYNNTVYNCSTAGIRDMPGSSVVAKNNIVQSSTDGYMGTFASGGDNNISDLASDAPGTNPHNSTTVSFVDVTNYDFHLSSPDTAAKGTGVNLQNDLYLHFSQDIDGQERTGNWDIGADEFDAGTAGSPNVSADTIEDGLIGYWSFNGADVSGTTAYDRSGNNNNGVINNATAGTGKFGQGLVLNGSTSNINVGDPSSGMFDFNVGQDFSHSFWFKRNSDSVSKFLFAKGAGSTGDTGYAVILGGGITPNALFSRSGETARLAITGTSINNNNWHHVVVSNTRTGNCIIYVDGVQNAIGDISAYNVNLSNSKNFVIGAATTSPNTSVFGGSLDEVRVYNRALSSDEVGSLYRSGQVKIGASQNARNTDGLVGLWSFDGPDVSGTTAYDRSGNGNNGVAASAPIPVGGKNGQALNFSRQAPAQYMQISGSGSLQNVTDSSYTFTAWLRPTEIPSGTNNNIFVAIGRVGFHTYLGYDSTKHFLFATYNNSNTNYTAVSTLTYDPGEWHRVVTVVDTSDSSLKIYVDGQLAGSNNYTGTPRDYGVSNYFIGSSAANSCSADWNFCFIGDIDDVRIYNRALSADEISNLYRMGQVKIRK